MTKCVAWQRPDKAPAAAVPTIDGARQDKAQLGSARLGSTGFRTVVDLPNGPRRRGNAPHAARTTHCAFHDVDDDVNFGDDSDAWKRAAVFFF